MIIINGIMLTWQNSYYSVQEGSLDKNVQQSLLEIINGVKDLPGFQIYWKARKPTFLREFQDYLEVIMAADKVNSEGIYTIKKDTT